MVTPLSSSPWTAAVKQSTGPSSMPCKMWTSRLLPVPSGPTPRSIETSPRPPGWMEVPSNLNGAAAMVRRLATG